jgi:hypothetical protein
MCASECKATTHSQFLASDIFRVALRERTYLRHRQIIEICVVRCVAPFSVLTVGTSVGALMPMRMLGPPLVFACVGDALFSLFRATGEFMFAGSRRLRFCRRRPLRFRLRRPVNGGDVLAREGVGFEGRGIRNWQHAVIGDDVRHHMRPTRLRAAIPVVADHRLAGQR